jgi:hypothetical protein
MTKRRRRKPKQQPREFLQTCAWCRRHVPGGDEVFGLSARAQPGVDLSQYTREGPVLFMPLPQAGTTVHAFVPAVGSPAKRSGADLVFMLCSQDCASDLRDALQRELYLAEFVGRYDA